MRFSLTWNTSDVVLIFLHSPLVPAQCRLALSSCSTIFMSYGELRKGLTTGSKILFRYFGIFKVHSTLFKNVVGRECTPHHLPQPQFLAHKAQLIVYQGGVEHGHEHLYDTDRYGSRLTEEFFASNVHVVTSNQPLSCR